MEKKTVLVIEDDRGQREALVKTLEIYGFNAIGPEKITLALKLLKTSSDEISVVITDMLLEDYSDFESYNNQRGSEITGIDLVRDLLKEQPACRPESIILSAYGKEEYYRKAMKAGASVYLLKGNSKDRDRLVALTQALALKYSFQPNPPNNRKITMLIDGIANKSSLLESFCVNKLIPELDLCIGKVSYLLLFRYKNRPVSIHSKLLDIPQPDEFDYQNLHKKIFETLSNSTYYSGKDLALQTDEASGELRDFEYLQLIKSGDLEIALGITTKFPVEDTVREYGFTTPDLAEALIEQAKPNLRNFFEEMLSRWQEQQNARLEKLKASLEWSKTFQAKLNELLPDPLPSTGAGIYDEFEKLRNFSEEINAYNRQLNELSESFILLNSENKTPETRLSEIVGEIEELYDRQGYSEEISFELEADCYFSVDRDYFLKAVKKVAEWAFERRKKVKHGEKQTVSFSYEALENRRVIIIRENSERLPKSVRDRVLFAPMKPLNLAKLIFEYACHGKLIHATANADNGFGHIFKIELSN